MRLLQGLAFMFLLTGMVRHSPLSGSERAPLAPIDLNTATVTELMQLPRVGQRTAERIVALRKQQGAFRRVEEIMNVKGVGEKTFSLLRPHLRVATPASGGGAPNGAYPPQKPSARSVDHGR